MGYKLIKVLSTFVTYHSRVALTIICVEYDSRVVKYDFKVFVRLDLIQSPPKLLI